MNTVRSGQLEALTRQGGVVVVDFTAEWCGPCKVMGPRLEKVATRIPSATFVKADVDECTSEVKSFGLRNVPTIVVLKSGVEVARHAGLLSEAGVMALVQPHL